MTKDIIDNSIKKDYERGGTQKDLYLESDITFVSCPYCNIDRCEKIYRERGVLGIVRCLECNMIYVNPRLKEPDKIYCGDADKYYKEAKLIFEGKAVHHRDPNYFEDIKTIYKYKPSGNFLDVGTNMGFFLRNVKKWHWDIFGVEPSPSLSNMAREYFGLNVKTAFLENAGFENNFFDVVTMTDVFEHITEPSKILGEVHKILKPDGIIFIKVPNGLFNVLKLYFAKITGKLDRYDIFDSYEHVVHYSDKTLRAMLGKNGFKVKKIKIGKPIQLPTWHNFVGHYYQYPVPWMLDYKRQSARNMFYLLSLVEYRVRLNKVGCLAPNIIAIAEKR